MRLLIVRHGHAVEREEFAALGKSDRFRPLSKRGERRTPLIAQGLKLIEPKLSIIFSSPYVRCVQTADIISKAYAGTQVKQIDALRPSGTFPAVLSTIRKNEIKDVVKDVVCLVGHEPQLSLFITQLLAKSPNAILELKKGGACLIQVTSSRKDEARLEAKLIYCLTPRQLMTLGQK